MALRLIQGGRASDGLPGLLIEHAGMVVVADGTDLAAQKLERVLTSDPAMGVLRHADAGYEHAIVVARERGVRVPMLDED